ncbi:MAG: FHA domain-containing protein, partial [Armatimonadetes bacterium]|nr:FHA domain-containing protein [Armatimonadota bacterium]
MDGDSTSGFPVECGRREDRRGGASASGFPGHRLSFVVLPQGGASVGHSREPATLTSGCGMPTLTVIQGPDRGKAFEVDGANTLIGRDPACDVCLDDPGVSRHHASLEIHGNRHVLKDAGSANGTFVNGVRVEESPLHAGDQIRVGNTILTVGRPMPGGALVDHRGLPIRVDSEGRVDASIISTETASGEPHLAFAGGEDMAGMRTSVIGLKALYRIAEMLAHGFDVDRLLANILDMVFDVVDADRGFILLRDERTGSMVPRAIRWREELLEEIRREQAGADASSETAVGELPPAAAPKTGPICVSRTIINYVMKRGEGVLSTNAMQDQRFEEGESVQDYGIRSAICVPIRSGDEILGIVHVDTHVSQGQFSPEDLKLMTAIGCQTGLAVQNARLLASQVQQERLAAVGQAVASVSHYIRNILQGIQGGSRAVETGLQKKDLAPVEKGWDVVSRNLRRVNELVLNMLSYSREAPPNRARTSVNAVVREVVELAQPAAAEKRVTLSTRLGKDLPEIPLDPDGLHHALLNILANAIEAVPALSGKVDVQTRPSPKGDEVWVIVADNGPGIPRGEQQRVFQPFFSTKG